MPKVNLECLVDSRLLSCNNRDVKNPISFLLRLVSNTIPFVRTVGSSLSRLSHYLVVMLTAMASFVSQLSFVADGIRIKISLSPSTSAAQTADLLADFVKILNSL